MSAPLIALLAAVLVLLVCAGGLLFFRARCVEVVPPGTAVVVTRTSALTIVAFQNVLVLPGIHHATRVDLTVQLLKVERGKANPLLSRDEQRFRGVFTFYLRIAKTEEGVLSATQVFGESPTESAKLRDCFLPKFDEALDVVAATLDGAELLRARSRFKDEVFKVIGVDLNGFCLDDLAIDELVRLER